MTRSYAAFLILVLSAALAACGGSGTDRPVDNPDTGGVVDNPNTGEPPDPPTDPGEPPGPQPADPLEEVNVIVLSDAIFDLEDRRVRVDTWECREDLSFICTARFEGLEAYADPRGDFTYEVLGEWEHLHVAGVFHDDTTLFAATAGVSHANSLPTGSATWTGNMVGIFRPPETPLAEIDHVLVRGGAEITLVDFQTPAIDVVLTPDSLPAMTWRAIRVTEDGDFHQDLVVTADAPWPGPPNRASYIRGEFYGPNAEEVGGVFERAGIIGAFGAERQQ